MLKRVLLFVLFYQLYLCSVWCVTPKMAAGDIDYSFVETPVLTRLVRALNEFHGSYSQPEAPLSTLMGNASHVDRLRLVTPHGEPLTDILFDTPVGVYYPPYPPIPVRATPKEATATPRNSSRSLVRGKEAEPTVTQAQHAELQAQVAKIAAYVGTFTPTPMKSNNPTHRFHANIVRIANPYYGKPHNHRHTHTPTCPWYHCKNITRKRAHT
jgi:hypothetical protein